jgi:hypothetical protein
VTLSPGVELPAGSHRLLGQRDSGESEPPQIVLVSGWKRLLDSPPR